ncbi:hypothetical protein [Lichenihabitans psoromatis]|uniref:hypothetical protein n=1 Tax=Lichenihabitans psoromatis TaxID=2528642 RepID=UPI001035CCC6|nr:hypothetical protein [Lichenihabitans psoromatis]
MLSIDGARHSMIALQAYETSATQWRRAACAPRDTSLSVCDMASARLIRIGLRGRQRRALAEMVALASIGSDVDRLLLLIQESGASLAALRARLPLLRLHAPTESIAHLLRPMTDGPVVIAPKPFGVMIEEDWDAPFDPLLVELVIPTTPRWLDFALGGIRAANTRRAARGIAPLTIARNSRDPAAAAVIMRLAAAELLVPVPVGGVQPGTFLVIGGTMFSEVEDMVSRAVATGRTIVGFDDGTITPSARVHLLAREENSFYENLVENLTVLADAPPTIGVSQAEPFLSGGA